MLKACRESHKSAQQATQLLSIPCLYTRPGVSARGWEKNFGTRGAGGQPLSWRYGKGREGGSVASRCEVQPVTGDSTSKQGIPALNLPGKRIDTEADSSILRSVPPGAFDQRSVLGRDLEVIRTQPFSCATPIHPCRRRRYT